jgi:hypothetical protein
MDGKTRREQRHAARTTGLFASLADAADDHIVDPPRIKPVSLNECGQDSGQQVGGMHL